MDMKDLETKLQESQDSRVRLVATDGVFSMGRLKKIIF